jgi:hypothetical protein
MSISKPSPARLREVLGYTPETGELHWLSRIGSRALAGAIAGTPARQGHLVVRVDKQLLMAHHIAWSLIYDCWPDELICHKNGVRSDNRAENLYKTAKIDLGRAFTASKLTRDNVHEIFTYRDGALIWNAGAITRRPNGAQAGYLNADGYVVIEVAGQAQLAHRLVWLMHHGAWPEGEIDHKNGVRNDNRIDNLRDVARVTNTENRRLATTGSASGFLGVSIHHTGKFRARIRADGVLKSLGLFETPEDAHAAYVNAKRRLHKGCLI